MALNTNLAGDVRCLAVRSLETTGHQYYRGTLDVLARLRDDASFQDKKLLSEVAGFVTNRLVELGLSGGGLKSGEAGFHNRKRIDEVLESLSTNIAPSEEEKHLLQTARRLHEGLEQQELQMARRVQELKGKIKQIQDKAAPDDADRAKLQRLQARVKVLEERLAESTKGETRAGGVPQ